MQIRVYNGEHFERSIGRFIAFGTVLAGVIGLSLWFVNLFGAIMLFLFTGAYILFSLTKNKHINLTIRDTGFVVDTRLWSRPALQSFCVEVNKQTQQRENIVIIMRNEDHMIFSLDDTNENKQAFIVELQKILPLTETYPQTFMDKLARKLKL